MPPIHITTYPPVNPTDPQRAKQEAALIGNLTTVALTRAGFPAFVSGIVGNRISTSLGSTEGLAALQAVNGIAQTAEAAQAALIGAYLSPESGPVNGYGFLDYGGPGS